MSEFPEPTAGRHSCSRRQVTIGMRSCITLSGADGRLEWPLLEISLTDFHKASRSSPRRYSVDFKGTLEE